MSDFLQQELLELLSVATEPLEDGSDVMLIVFNSSHGLHIALEISLGRSRYHVPLGVGSFLSMSHSARLNALKMARYALLQKISPERRSGK